MSTKPPSVASLAEQRRLYEIAYKTLDQAVSLEERGSDRSSALSFYQQGASQLHGALSLSFADSDWQKAQVLVIKMRKTLTSVQERINSLSKLVPLSAAAVRPSGSQTSQSGLPPNTDHELANYVLNEILVAKQEVKWGDVAGLTDAKRLLQELVILPVIRPDLYTGLRTPANSVLFFGPPGTGKTMIAKALANECNSNFFALSASSLVSKYMGESEKLVRTLFDIARHLGKSILFFDEVDAILGKRKEEGEHEASRRLKTEFLVQFDGVKSAAEPGKQVVVIAATNRPQELDEAARRRFIHRIYIPLPEYETRLSLLQKLISKEKHALSDRQIVQIVQHTDGYSCSDITALAKEAAMEPLRELTPSVLARISKEDVRRMTVADFKTAMRHIRASVSQKEVEQVEEWAREFGSSS